MGEVSPVSLGKAVGQRLIHRVSVALLGHFHIREVQHECADFGLQRKAVNSLSGRVHEDGGSAVEHVAGGHLFPAGLQHRRFPGGSLRATQDRENGAHTNVHIDVGRAVQRVKDHDVLPAFGVVDRHRVFVLLGDQEGHAFARAQTMQQGVVGVDVEFLLRLTLDVGCVG